MKMIHLKCVFLSLGFIMVQSCGDAETQTETKAMGSSQKAALSAFLQNSEDSESAEQAPENKVVVCEHGEGWTSFEFQDAFAASGRSTENACITFSCQFLPDGWRFLVKKSPTLEGDASTEAKANSAQTEASSRASAKADLSELFITLNSLHKKGHWLCAEGEASRGEAQPPAPTDNRPEGGDNSESTEEDEPDTTDGSEQEEQPSAEPDQDPSGFSIYVGAKGQLIVK